MEVGKKENPNSGSRYEVRLMIVKIWKLWYRWVNLRDKRHNSNTRIPKFLKPKRSLKARTKKY